MNQKVANAVSKNGREVVGVIGGGTVGCLTALALIRDGFHPIIIEKNPQLMKGASECTFHFHEYGFEYPKDPQTARHCMKAAVVWKLLMSPDIYLPEKMMFLLDKGSEMLAQRKKAGEKLSPLELEQALSMEEYEKSIEKVRKRYKKMFKRVQKTLNLTEKQTLEILHGSYKKKDFYRHVNPEEYAAYPQITGGFESQERNFNLIELIARIEYALEQEVKKGNATIFTNHRVTPHAPEAPEIAPQDTGIRGTFGNFTIHCKALRKEVPLIEEDVEPIRVSQVVQTAAAGGPEITPLASTRKGQESIKVYLRGMMRADITSEAQENWPRSAFVFCGPHYGGMLLRHHNAIVGYRPGDPAYINDEDLTAENPSLRRDWDILSEDQYAARKHLYYESLKQRFPSYQDTENPHLYVRETISTRQLRIKRPFKLPQEETAPVISGMSMRLLQDIKQIQIVDQKPTFRDSVEHTKGWFTGYIPKGTYAMMFVVQIASMVKYRSDNPDLEVVRPPKDTLDIVLQQPHRYSLVDVLKPPPKEYYLDVIERHAPDLSLSMLEPGFFVDLQSLAAKRLEQLSRQKDKHRPFI